MDVLEFLRGALFNKSVETIKLVRPEVSSSGESISGGTTGEAKVTGKGGKYIIAPIKNCEFIAALGEASDWGSSTGKWMFLKKFNIPEAGVKFSSSEETMWFPNPSIELPQFQMESYINSEFRGTIANLYYNQFRAGLLSLNKGVTITIGYTSYTERTQVDVKSLRGAALAIQAALDSAGEAVTAALNALKNPKQVAEDTIEDAKKVKELTTEELTNLAFHPILTVRGLRFSKPTITQDSTSNDFSLLTVQGVYSDFVDITKELR